MTRILLQTIGTGGPANPVWESLAFAVRTLKPDVLVQWCSGRTRDETISKFDSALSAADRPKTVRYGVCANEEDVAALALAYAREIDRLRAEFPDSTIEVDYTSGTKAMSAAAVAAAVARRVPYLHYGTGPRDPSGRATRTDKLVSLPTDHLIADPLLFELGRLFGLGEFEAVRMQAAKLATSLDDPTLKARAWSLESLATVYDLWDRFDWKRAHSVLHRVRRKPGMAEAGWDKQLLEGQLSHLHHCQRNEPSPQRLTDLLANADRCLTRGRCDDAVARLYRLVEYIGQARLASERFQIPSTSRAPIAAVRAIAPVFTASWLERRSENGTVDLGLRDNIEVLAEGGDPVGKLMHSLYAAPDPEHPQKPGILKGLLDTRNESLLAHGSTPIGAESTRGLRRTAGEFLGAHLQHVGYKLEDLLAVAVFAQCPWALPEGHTV